MIKFIISRQIFSHKLYAPVQLDRTNNTADYSQLKLDYRFFLEQTDDMNNVCNHKIFN